MWRDTCELFYEVYCGCSSSAYGCSAHAIDEYVRIGEDTILEATRRYTRVVIDIFGPEYLKAPNKEDTRRLLASNEKRDGLGC